MKEFCENMAEVLEVPSVSMETNFRDLPLWSSLVAFAIIIMIEQRYKKRISVADLSRATTIADLASIINL